MTIPVDHPVVRGAALEMAREALSEWESVVASRWPRSMRDEIIASQAWRDEWVDAHASLLTDLSRPASRDWWVRWLDKIDASYRSEQGRYDLDALRDNPTALTAAVLAALESVAGGIK